MEWPSIQGRCDLEPQHLCGPGSASGKNVPRGGFGSSSTSLDRTLYYVAPGDRGMRYFWSAISEIGVNGASVTVNGVTVDAARVLGF